MLRCWGLNRSLALGAGGSPLPGKRQPGEASPVAPPLPARCSAPCRSRRLPPQCPALLPVTKKPPGKSGGRDRRRRSCRGIAAPIAEIPGRPSFERSCHPRRGPNGRVGAQALRCHCITRRLNDIESTFHRRATSVLGDSRNLSSAAVLASVPHLPPAASRVAARSRAPSRRSWPATLHFPSAN